MDKKGLLISVLTVVATLIFVFVGHDVFSDYNTISDEEIEVYKAKVVSVDSSYEQKSDFGGMDKSISFTAKMTSGEYKGADINCFQDFNSMFAMTDKEIEAGDSILVSYSDMTATGAFEWTFIGYNRFDALFFLCAAFLLLVIAIGRSKGVSTIVSLMLTVIIIFFVYVPAILSGFDVYLATAMIGIVTILMSLILINGVNKKTLCAVLGNLGGVFITAVLAYFMNDIMKMTGVIDEHYIYLTYIDADKPLNLIAICWGGMVLGALGAIMDVAMSIASSMHELSEHMQNRTFTKMMRSGMNIGRDAIGTMSNTLILAYIGGSLALVLLLIANTKNALYLFSMEMIAVQVVQAVTGSMGILFAVPFTAAFAAYIYNKDEAKEPPADTEPLD